MVGDAAGEQQAELEEEEEGAAAAAVPSGNFRAADDIIPDEGVYADSPAEMRLSAGGLKSIGCVRDDADCGSPAALEVMGQHSSLLLLLLLEGISHDSCLALEAA